MTTNTKTIKIKKTARTKKTDEAKASKPAAKVTRNKSRAGDFGNETKRKTLLWTQTITPKTAWRIDNALKNDEHVIADKLVDQQLFQKVMSLEIKRWKVVTQLTDKIVNLLDEKELAIVCHGNNVADPWKVRYQFRKLCAKFAIDTSYLGVANSKQKKASYYTVKRFKQTGKKSQAYLVNELASKLSVEYMLRAGDDDLARRMLEDIIAEVKQIVEARVS